MARHTACALSPRTRRASVQDPMSTCFQIPGRVPLRAATTAARTVWTFRCTRLTPPGCLKPFQRWLAQIAWNMWGAGLNMRWRQGAKSTIRS